MCFHECQSDQPIIKEKGGGGPHFTGSRAHEGGEERKNHFVRRASVRSRLEKRGGERSDGLWPPSLFGQSDLREKERKGKGKEMLPPAHFGYMVTGHRR